MNVLLRRVEEDAQLAGLLARETSKEDVKTQERTRDRKKRPAGSRGLNRIESDESEDSSEPERSRSKDREGQARRNEKEIETINVEEEEDEEEVTEGTLVLAPEVPRKRGRSPTTGDYSKIADEKERVNRAKEEALKLENEERIMRLTSSEIVKMTKINPEKVMDIEEHNPTADIINRLRELQVEVLKVARTSSNHKGQYQGQLKKSAEWTMGLIEILRTRLDRSVEESRSEEMKALKSEQEILRKETERKIAGMEAALQKAMEMAEMERRKAEFHQNLLMEARMEKEELRNLQEIKEERDRWWGEKGVPMEVVEEPHMEPQTKEPTIIETVEEGEEVTTPSLPPKRRIEAMEEERRAYPIKRPAIKGKVRIIEDKPIDVTTERNEKGEGFPRELQEVVKRIAKANRSTLKGNTIITEKGTSKTDKGRKKKERKPNWSNMEVYSSQTPDPTLAEITEMVTRKVIEQLCGEGRNAPPLPSREDNRTKPAPSSSTTSPLKGGCQKRERGGRRRKGERRGGRRRDDAPVRQSLPPHPHRGPPREESAR